MRLLFRWFVVILVALHSVLGAMPLVAQGNSHAVSQSADARDRMQLTLVGDAIGPNRARLTLTATPTLDAPALKVKWDAGAARLEGGAVEETLGAFVAYASLQAERTVSFGGQGVYALGALVTYEPYTGAQVGASGMLFAIVAADGTVTLTTRDPNAGNLMHSTAETIVTVVEEAVRSAGVDAPDDDPCFTVRGTILREDRVNTSTGQLAPSLVPVRFAMVDLREEDILFDDSYRKGLTDANGNFSFAQFCDDDGFFDNELEIYIRVRAELRDGGLKVSEVTDSSWIDETYEFDSAIVKSEGGTLVINMNLTGDQGAVMNIADAAWDAYTFWNASGGAFGDDAKFRRRAQIHWERGYGDATSYYNGYIFDEITVADSPDPDQWDDSVIIHEWGHMADDQYGCDDNPGGNHSFGQTLDPELAWGEGYPDYWQSAVRTATGANSARFYIDADNNGNNRITLDLETLSGAANPNIEDAVASMLWDLNDNVNDGQDTVSYGHTPLQVLYTHSTFESNGDIFDDDCTANVYLRSWRDIGFPTDGVTAATVTQNVGLANPFAATSSAMMMTAAGTPQEALGPAAVYARRATPEDYVWWQKVTMLADNSSSMAGAKFDGVKTVMKEQVNDLDDSPKGVEFGLYNFNNVVGGSNELARGRFFGDAIVPVIDGMTTRPPGEAAEPCAVDAFGPMAQAIQDKRNGETWLYTDGDAISGPGVEETMQQMLTTRGLRASFVLLGGCGSAATPQPDTTGAAYNFLGKAANGQPMGIVPYILTALATGGNFLFVNEAQLSDAGDVLRAQLSHSAGAGRWSDYVSYDPTYRWDRLTSWEYNWIPFNNYVGQAVQNDVVASIPTVTVYERAFNQVQITRDGYIRMGPPNQQFFIAADYLDILSINNTEWYYNCCNVATAANTPDTPDAPDVGFVQSVYVDVSGEWVVITVDGLKYWNVARTYQTLINTITGEIRYQYLNIPSGEAGSANIGVSEYNLVTGLGYDVTISNSDVSGAAYGKGYKLVPAPPQPTKTYTVAVDSQMGGIAFLLTGYNGTFNPLAVRDPVGNALSCDEAGALCLNLGLVQYQQFNINDRTGIWDATVSGDGTFSMNVMAVSALAVESPGDHQLSTGRVSPLVIKLGAAAAGNQLTAWFKRPDGTSFGTPFSLYDDGTQGDGLAGDGIFGLSSFTPPGTGVGHLWVRGMVDGTDVQRSDPTPYNFQPFQLDGPAEVLYPGGEANYVLNNFTLTNYADKRYCYYIETELPPGWVEYWAWLAEDQDADGLCLNPGESTTRQQTVFPNSLNDPAPTGTVGEMVVTFGEVERRTVVDSVVTRIVRFNAPARVEIENRYTSNYLRPNGSDVAELTVGVFDAQGYPVPDGTSVQLEATLGTVEPMVGTTLKGLLPFTFTSGNSVGDAEVKATVGELSATTVIPIQNAMPDPEGFTLEATPTDLRSTPNANLVVTVLDQWGAPVAGQQVRIGVSDDDLASGGISLAGASASSAQVSPLGIVAAIQASEVVTLTTDAEGKAAAIFTKAADAVGIGGSVVVRAELLFDQGSGLQVVAEQQVVLQLTDVPDPDPDPDPDPTADTFLFIPSIRGK